MLPGAAFCKDGDEESGMQKHCYAHHKYFRCTVWLHIIYLKNTTDHTGVQAGEDTRLHTRTKTGKASKQETTNYTSE